MKQFIIVFLLAFVSLNVHAQILFEKGYYIDNVNQRIEGWVRNVDWKSNPSKFKFKKSEGDEVQKITAKEVQEFGIYNATKFISRTVKMDRSPNNLSKLSNIEAPIFKEEKLFLKVILEGKASLYLYQDHNLIRFFYKKDEATVQPLIFKLYQKKNLRNKEKVSKNNTYKSQIWEELKCPTIPIATLKDLNYNIKELTKIFVKYNKYHNSESVFSDKQKRDLFHFALRPRVNYASFDIIHYRSRASNLAFDRKANWGIGTEFEVILPFYKNKLSIFLEPNYQHFAGSQVTHFNVLDTFSSTINYKSIEIPLGLRYFFFLNKKSKIFVNAFWAFDIDLNASLGLSANEEPPYRLYEAETGYNAGVGVGFKYNNRYSLELRYATEKDIFTRYVTWKSEYTYFSFILGYSFFRKGPK